MGLTSLPAVLRHRGLGGTGIYLARATRFAMARLLGCHRLRCHIWDGEYVMLVDPQDQGISRALAVSGKREMQLRALLEEEVKPGMCVFDLGANIGYYAIWEALRVGPEGKVYGIEPSPVNFALLQENLALNGLGDDQVEVFNLGAADRVGEADFFLAQYSNLHTFMPGQYRCGDRSRLLAGKTIRVPLTTVSEFAKGKRHIDLLRMDVEGFEVEVIAGMREAFERDPDFGPIIVFEAHFPKYDDTNHSMREQLRYLFGRGYRVTALTSNNECRNQNFLGLGYHPDRIIETSDVVRQGIYRDFRNEDAEKLICDLGGVRDVVLKKN